MYRLRLLRCNPQGQMVHIRAAAIDDTAPDVVLHEFSASYDPKRPDARLAAIQNIEAQFYAWVEAQAARSVLEEELSAISEDSLPGTFTSDLELLKEARVRELEWATQLYVCRRYPWTRQVSFLRLAHDIEKELADPNTTDDRHAVLDARMARLKALEAWLDSVLDYHYQKDAEIRNATTEEEVKAITWDFSQFDATDPQVRIRELRD